MLNLKRRRCLFLLQIITLHIDASMDLIQYDTKHYDFSGISFIIDLKTIILIFCDLWRSIGNSLKLCVQLIRQHFDIFQNVIKSTLNLTERNQNSSLDQIK